MDEDNALLLVREQDMRKRMNGGQELIEYLSSDGGDIQYWSNVDKIIDSLCAYWVSSSNYKVALLGLDILSLLVERLQREFQPYYNLIQTALVDRLGDQKDQVRDASITLLTNIMDVAASPQYLFERLSSSFTHKVWRVREGLCRLLVATINRFGAKSLYLSKLLPHVCKLISDQNAQVREVAMSTVVEIYRHVGERVRQDLAKKGIPASRLAVLNAKFDEVYQSGDMVNMASDNGSVASSTGSFDSVDSGSGGMMRPPLSNMVVNSNNNRLRASSSSSTTNIDGIGPSKLAQRNPPKESKSVPLVTRSNAGALDEESFSKDFSANLPTVRLHGAKDLDEQILHIKTILSDERKDWEERTKMLKILRAVIVAGGTEYPSFMQHLRLLEPALQLNAKDLRSQVVRETCMTIGLLSFTLKEQFDHTAVFILPTLCGLISNSAKIMSSSGVLCIWTILKHSHIHRLIPLIIGYCSSKTNTIRRNSLSFIDLIFLNWSTHIMERYVQSLKDVVFKGINDADSETREEARKAWRGLHKHFPREADQVFNKLNAQQQKLIKGDAVTDASSTGSLPRAEISSARKSRTTGIGPRRIISKAPPSAGLRSAGTASGRFLRSRSDIDPGAAQRSAAKMKASMNRMQLPGRVARPATSRSSMVNNMRQSNAERGRDSQRPAISQPGSRSNSPNSHRRYGLGRTPRRLEPKTPTGNHKSASTSGRSQSSVSNQGIPPMRVLPKGREGEQALSDALSRKIRREELDYGNSDNDDEMSDTSSVCSDRSSSYTSSRAGKRRPQPSHTEDMVDIIHLCQSSAWTERKEGITCLHSVIVKKKEFTRLQLKKVLEIFNRMFADPHSKVFSMYLELLPDFISNYKELIHDWMYILLTQLLKKMGADLLGSVQSKVLNALQVSRESFPTTQQFNILSRYIVDQTQRPNLKVKIALLHYLIELVATMESKEITNTSDSRLAISRVITWTSEPKSVDVRKYAEALVVAIFELNAPTFTLMIRVLPKTFQDGAMKVLHTYMKTNGETNKPKPDHGQVVGQVGLSPSYNTVSPSATGSIDIMSPRGSISNHDSENMNREEITENFRDITAGIQKLRMDSSTDFNDVVARKWSYNSAPDDSPTTNQGGTLGSSPVLPTTNYQPSFQHLKDSSNISTNRKTEYNPNSYTAKDSGFSPKREHLREAIFDDEDSFNEDLPIEPYDSNISDVAEALTNDHNRHHALNKLTRALHTSDAVGGLAASQIHNQWDQYFGTILTQVLDCMRKGPNDLRISALQVLKEMLRHHSSRFKNYAEVTILHILEVHKTPDKTVLRFAEETAAAMCRAVPLLCIRVLGPLVCNPNGEETIVSLKMLTNSINKCTKDDFNDATVNGLVPGLLLCYDHNESSVRKAAVFSLVALHRVIGIEELGKYLTSLPMGKMKLLQLYVKRSQAVET